MKNIGPALEIQAVNMKMKSSLLNTLLIVSLQDIFELLFRG